MQKNIHVKAELYPLTVNIGVTTSLFYKWTTCMCYGLMFVLV